MTAAQALRRAKEALAGSAGDECAAQARLLVAHALGCEPAELAVYAKRELDSAKESWLFDALRRRRMREPLQYILGEWGFMGLSFTVRPGALIPRPDTEVLCERALLEAKKHGYRTALDLCCGTGCIGVALAKLGGVTVTASDISSDCVALTTENARRNGVSLTTVQGSFFAPVQGEFDMILSNPPYISGQEMDTLAPELSYEPRLALLGGEDGLDAYRAIAAGYREHLAPGGMLLLEVGAGQARAVRALFGGAQTETVMDYNGIERVVVVHAPAPREEL